jgi:hypothetical protein
VTEPELAVILLEPIANPVANPVELIVAVAGLEEVQVTLSVISAIVLLL